MIYLIILLIFLSAWALITAVFFKAFYKEKAIDKLMYFDENYEAIEKFESHKKNNSSLLKKLSNFIPNSKFSNKSTKKLELELIKADMPITVEELLVIKILFSTTFAFLSYVGTKDFFIMLIAFTLVWISPKFIISSRKKERTKLFDSQLNEGIMIIANSLKAGYSFMQAVAAVAEETKDPFSKEFKKLLKEMSLGISDEDSLRNLLARMESEDLKLVINAILIQKDIGGNLSEILDNISETIRERQKIKNELKTLTAQGRLSGMIVVLIPVFLGMVIYLFNKEYIMLLFNTPLGLLMTGASLFNQFLGIIMIKKIIKIEM